MKILIIHNHWLEEGGEDRVVNSEIKLLRNHGHQIVVYIRSNKEFKYLSVRDKIRFFLYDIIWSKKSYDEINDIIIKEKPDIAHIHNIFLMITPSVYYALHDRGIPIVQTLHNYRFFCSKGIFYRKGKVCEECRENYLFPSIIHRCFRNSYLLSYFFSKVLRTHFKKSTFNRTVDCYIALSSFSKNKFIKLGLPENKICIKSNFVNIEIDDKEETQDYSLFVGRLVDYKGIKTLIKAYKQLPNCKLKIIGRGPLDTYLKKVTKKNRNIELLGQLTHKETIDYIKKAKFVVFPSECYENMPRVIVESFACGVPVVASRLGAMAKIVTEGKTGLHFTPQDASDLISKIRWSYSNPIKIEEMGRQAKKEYQQQYTAEKNYHILMDIYERTNG
ncbi:MAG: glycosyltransferase family 4 protein [Candidatus Omnitrophica bacterium]|nr:glycosyltransferase family 4 protein [Candidatus Omnitrophota bacterium]